jgi:hypothetical protein
VAHNCLMLAIVGRRGPTFSRVEAANVWRVAHPANLFLSMDLQEGAPLRLLLAGWGFPSSYENPLSTCNARRRWRVAHNCLQLAIVGFPGLDSHCATRTLSRPPFPHRSLYYLQLLPPVRSSR